MCALAPVLVLARAAPMPDVVVFRVEKGALDEEDKDRPRPWTKWRVLAPLVLLARLLKKLGRAIRKAIRGA